MAIFGTKKEEKKDQAKPAGHSAAVKTPAQKKSSESTEAMKDLYGAGKAKGQTGAAIVRNSKKQAFRILEKPMVTEKASILGKYNQYVFGISESANKISVAQAIFELYGINPISVNIINTKGKVVRTKRGYGQRKDRRKAVIRLPQGKTIDVYEGV